MIKSNGAKLILIITILSLIFASCQLRTTRPKRPSSSSGQTNESPSIDGSGNPEDESGKLDFPSDELIIDIKPSGNGSDTRTEDIYNNSTDSELPIWFKNKCPESILKNVTYELNATFKKNGENANEYFSISPKTHENDKVGPNLKMFTSKFKDILEKSDIGVQTTFAFELTIKSDSHKKETLKFYIIINRKDMDIPTRP